MGNHRPAGRLRAGSPGLTKLRATRQLTNILGDLDSTLVWSRAKAPE